MLRSHLGPISKQFQAVPAVWADVKLSRLILGMSLSLMAYLRTPLS